MTDSNNPLQLEMTQHDLLAPTAAFDQFLTAAASLTAHDLLAKSDARALAEIAERVRNKLIKQGQKPIYEMLRKRQAS